jgi:hypothetical protein
VTVLPGSVDIQLEPYGRIIMARHPAPSQPASRLDAETTEFRHGRRPPTFDRSLLFAEELGGGNFVSFNLYVLSGGRWLLKPCEMSSSKVLEFVVGFVPEAGLQSRKYGPVPLLS